jgi:aspartyl protease family protein
MAGGAQAAVTLLATLEDRAVFMVDGERRIVRVGESTSAFRLVSVGDDGAVIEADGRRRNIGLGQGYVAAKSDAGDPGGRLILSPDEQGHYFADVVINGHRERGVIDTGATHLSMSRISANAMDIEYTRGRRGQTQTAAGIMNVWLVSVPKLQVGTVTVFDVDVVVRDSPGQAPMLIGTSLLNRFQMARDQELMILTKKSY